MLTRPSEWLRGHLVVELGGRIAVSVCGTMLSQAGATVVYVEPRTGRISSGRFVDRAIHAAGKRSLAVDLSDSEDAELFADLLRKADVVLTSSDWDVDGLQIEKLRTGATICNFTAIGADNPERGLTEWDVQALSGVAHTSGFADGPPVVLRVPTLEYSAGVYGSAACAAALLTMRRERQAQQIEVTLFGCAINALASFLPGVFQGENPARLGNGHPLAVPWNAYPCKDGWILFCTASDGQWAKFCEILGRPEFALDPRFTTIANRAKNRVDVDAIVTGWTERHSVQATIAHLAGSGLAGGEIVSLAGLESEANVRHRQSIVEVDVPGSAAKVRLPNGILTDVAPQPDWQPIVPAKDADRAWLSQAQFASVSIWPEREADDDVKQSPARLPLDGVRIIEIGQYTTAPLSARHLAMYGAEIIKIEPLQGDPARRWAPLVNGTSVFFSISNSGKSCYRVDLKSPDHRKRLAELIKGADVLVENLKSGTLDALGLGVHELMQLNPRLIYCPITGFGARSAFPGRPAFDTVIQAMSGIMDANATNGMPLKAGISICDFMGGEVALFSIIAALHACRQSGRGSALDLSMQDIAIWTTASLWNEGGAKATCGVMVKCADGYVYARAGQSAIATLSMAMKRSEAIAALRAAGVHCVPVCTISEALNSDIGERLRLVRMVEAEGAGAAPVLASPVTMLPAKLKLGFPPGEAKSL